MAANGSGLLMHSSFKATLLRTCAILLPFIFPGTGAADGPDLFQLSLDQLMLVEIKSDIASIKSKPLEQQPGIVSVITAREISQRGARDLADVLLLVPGFALDTDVESMVGLTFRGLQGQEGKVLLLIDGIEINDPLYGSLPILHHISANLVEQVEIIRGPGAAVYGGSAALSVIRVTTKGSSQNGGFIYETPAWETGRFNNDLAFGFGYNKEEWRYSVSGSAAKDALSNRDYTALDGSRVDLTYQSDFAPRFVDVAAGWKGFDARLIYDRYRYDDPVDYGATVSPPNATRFDSLLFNARYEIAAADWLKVTPQFTWRRQYPWYVDGTLGIYDIRVDRYQGDLIAVADLSSNSGLMLGTRVQRDSAHADDVSYDEDEAATYYDGKSSIAYDDYAVFAQYDLDLPWASLSGGLRNEYHEAVGHNVVPRLALTKAWDQLHLKLLYSRAARIPAINVIKEAQDGEIDVEQADNYEMEVGYKFTERLSLTANLFYIDINDPIIYSAGSGSATEGYYNASELGSAGYESELRWNAPQLSAYLSYSWYNAVENEIDYLRGDGNQFLAAPTHKISFSGTWHILEQLDWNINGYWLEDRLAYTWPDAAISELPQESVFNSFLEYRFNGIWGFGKELSLGAGINNLLNDSRFAPQPYAGGTAPLPLRGRELFLRAGLKF